MAKILLQWHSAMLNELLRGKADGEGHAAAKDQEPP